MSKNAAVDKPKTKATRKKKINDDENDIITVSTAPKKKTKSNEEEDIAVKKPTRSRKKAESNEEDDTAARKPRSRKKQESNEDDAAVTKPTSRSRKKPKSNEETDDPVAKPRSRKKGKSDNENGIADTEKTAAAKSKKKKRKSDDDDSDAAVTKAKARKTKKEAVKNGIDEGENKQEEVKVKTIIIKGKAPVDSECTEKVGAAHVYTMGDDIYDAMLNQTNLQNNNNKYYIIQLLEDDKQKSYDVWFRWGRVGKKGQTSLIPCGSNLDKAMKTFKQKFLDKTKNHWDDRSCFQKVSGKYDLLQMDYNTEDDKKAVKKDVKKKEVKQLDSKIHERIKSLIELICDVKAMEEAVMEMQYDAKKAPLGKLTTNQIKAGYTALKKIEKCITENKTSGQELLNACNEFYTRIPHDFGMKRPPLITNQSELQLKIQLLEALGDIQIALKMLKDEVNDDEHPADRHYHSLCCQLQPLERSDETFKILEEYLHNTHAKTHNQYKLEVIDIFECDKDGEKEKFKDLGNRALLWHGSRLTNWAGILKQGLRIAPPEAPVTGYMFGKGVYFADMCSKSANYCFATRQKNEGLLVLCEVSLGNSRELLDSDYDANKLPKGKNSVKGLGSTIPDPKSDRFLPDGVRVPLGKGINSGVKNPNSYTLNYNEYIVYDTSQIRMRYLMRVRFKF